MSDQTNFVNIFVLPRQLNVFFLQIRQHVYGDRTAQRNCIIGTAKGPKYYERVLMSVGIRVADRTTHPYEIMRIIIRKYFRTT